MSAEYPNPIARRPVIVSLAKKLKEQPVPTITGERGKVQFLYGVASCFVAIAHEGRRTAQQRRIMPLESAKGLKQSAGCPSARSRYASRAAP